MTLSKERPGLSWKQISNSHKTGFEPFLWNKQEWWKADQCPMQIQQHRHKFDPFCFPNTILSLALFTFIFNIMSTLKEHSTERTPPRDTKFYENTCTSLEPITGLQGLRKRNLFFGSCKWNGGTNMKATALALLVGRSEMSSDPTRMGRHSLLAYHNFHC